jgi:hypothetical protein
VSGRFRRRNVRKLVFNEASVSGRFRRRNVRKLVFNEASRFRRRNVRKLVFNEASVFFFIQGEMHLRIPSQGYVGLTRRSYPLKPP